MRTAPTRCLILIVATTVACAGCHLPLRHPPGRDGITRILERQADAWNRGDIDAFMDAYDRSPGLTFSSGGRVTRGWEPTLANYHRRYPNREAMGHLTFSQLEITTLGQDAALVLGRWKLHRAEPIGGVFTLVFRRHAGRWVIVHDHTSKAPAD